eukprot:jgi/Galph1/3092/GphlegSOOS_G1728.1
MHCCFQVSGTSPVIFHYRTPLQKNLNKTLPVKSRSRQMGSVIHLLAFLYQDDAYCNFLGLSGFGFLFSKANTALADGPSLLLPKSLPRRRYGPRITNLESDVKLLDDYIHEKDWTKSWLLKKYSTVQKKTKTGKFWEQKPVFQLFTSQLFRDDKETLKELEKQQQQFYAAATRLSKAAAKENIAEAVEAYNDLKNSYYRFLHESKLSTADSSTVEAT